MVSYELLRRYPSFGPLSEEQLKAIAKIAEEKTFPKDTYCSRKTRLQTGYGCCWKVTWT